MKDRIRKALEAKLDENPLDTNLLRQQTLLNNAQITTIDSFCLWIIKNHFSEIDLDPGFRTADQGEIKLLGADVLDDLIEEYYEKQDKEVESIDFKGAIAGGGRYDNLIGKFLGQQVSAVGFSIGFERIFSILMENGVDAKSRPERIAMMYDEGEVNGRG